MQQGNNPGEVVLEKAEVPLAVATLSATRAREDFGMEQGRTPDEISAGDLLARRLSLIIARTFPNSLRAELSADETAALRACGYLTLMRERQALTTMSAYYVQQKATTREQQEAVFHAIDPFTSQPEVLVAKTTIRLMPGLKAIMASLAKLAP